MSLHRHATLAAVLLLAAACGGGGGGGGFQVRGTASGLQGSGLVLHLAAGTRAEDLAVSAAGHFAFSTRLADGAAYEVTVKTDPAGPSQACAVTGGSATIAGADANVAVTCTTRSFPVGGTVTGLAAGSTVTLRNNGGDDLVVDAEGAFTFATPVPSGAAYAVTVAQQPAAPAQTCVVGNGAGSVGGGPVTGVTVSCEPNDKPVAGQVDGLLGGGLVLRVNGAFDTPVSAAGGFQVLTNLRAGAAYAVSVGTQPTAPWQTCQVTAGGAGVMGPTGAAGVVVTCTTDTFAVGGTASGVLVPGLSLALTVGGVKGPAMAVGADGSFTFADEVPSGAAWLVTVESSPSSQACAVSGGGGVMAGAAVGDVAVACGCAPGLGNCNGVAGDGCETSTLTDVAHCGGCGNACAFANAGAACTNGTCQLGACLAGYGDCDASPADGCETDVRSDPSHCGSCLTACAPLPHAAAACADRSCALGACAAGWGNCNGLPADGCETDLLTAVAHCGGCNRPCTVTNGVPACSAGACRVASCNPGYGDCNGVLDDGCETDVTSSVAHCGGCGHACTYANAAATCAASTCAMGACDPGYSDCNHDPTDGCESPASTDPLNCGGCGVVCSTLHGTAACFGAACSMSACDPGWGDCQGSAVAGCETDTRITHDHCGSCGHACAPDQVCAAGNCLALPSCLAILEAARPSTLPDGLYDIDPTQSGTAIQVWCDMTTDGGGWTFFAHLNDDYQAADFFTTNTGTYDPSRADTGATYGLGATVYQHIGATELMVSVINPDPTLTFGDSLVLFRIGSAPSSFLSGPIPSDQTSPSMEYAVIPGSWQPGSFQNFSDTEWQAFSDGFEGVLRLDGNSPYGTAIGGAVDPLLLTGWSTTPYDSWWYAR